MKKILDISQTVVYANIQYHPGLKAKLHATGGRIIGEATSKYLWGIDVLFNIPDVLDQFKWNGKNVISEAFMVEWAETIGEFKYYEVCFHLLVTKFV